MVTDHAVADRFAAARAVADAVLYEGYLLYPYRASAAKNQVRWQFGVVVPPAYADVEPSERSRLSTEVIVDPGARPVLTVRVRFMQIEQRTGGDRAWDEGQLREIDLAPIALLPVAGTGHTRSFHLDGSWPAGDGASVVSDALDGEVTVVTSWADGAMPLIAVEVAVANVLDWDPAGARRDEAVRHSFVGVHALLGIDDGSFVSSIDPGDDARTAVGACRNEGLFPVLLGDEGCADVVLAAPIILYDHPAVAPESQGDMFDATEIDEILALRVLTLTDDEKAEARRTDPRAAAIVDRCDDMPPELWSRLHGAIRSLEPAPDSRPADEALPWWEPAIDEQFDPFTDALRIGTTLVAAGTPVTLRPSRRADAHDMFLAGMDATVSGIFQDVDGDALVAVTLDDDPATEALVWQGRYLFFHPDEIEVRT